MDKNSPSPSKQITKSSSFSILEAEAGGSQGWGQPGYIVRPYLKNKNKNKKPWNKNHLAPHFTGSSKNAKQKISVESHKANKKERKSEGVS
jgi:hypothetical protein